MSTISAYYPNVNAFVAQHAKDTDKEIDNLEMEKSELLAYERRVKSLQFTRDVTARLRSITNRILSLRKEHKSYKECLLSYPED